MSTSGTDVRQTPPSSKHITHYSQSLLERLQEPNIVLKNWCDAVDIVQIQQTYTRTPTRPIYTSIIARESIQET